MMSEKSMEAVVLGIAATMAVGGAAYMATHQNPMKSKIKKLKKTTEKALKGMGTIATDISNLVG